jgi:hypothetical protein
MSQETKTAAEPVVRLRRVEVKRVGQSIFIPLPRELWIPCDGCCCVYCSPVAQQSNPEAYWDTLAVSTNPREQYTWTVHAPELHGARKKR